MFFNCVSFRKYSVSHKLLYEKYHVVVFYEKKPEFLFFSDIIHKTELFYKIRRI